MVGALAAPISSANILTASNNTVSFSGKVIDDKTKQPLPGAAVFIEELKYGDESDLDGEFVLEGIKKGRYTIICQYLGYEEIKKEISLIENVQLTFYMTPMVLKFSEVTVIADQDQLRLTRAPQSVTILAKEELEKHRDQTLAETMEEIPGVTVLQTGPSIAKPVVRGLHSQRVLVLNAGVPQEGQQWGAEHAPEIDPFAPARIEVLKGAAGVEYGSGAIGGVVRVEPRELNRITGLGGQMSVNAFSNNSQGAGSLMLEGHVPFHRRLGWRLQGSFRKAGDSRTPEYVINNSGFEERDWSFAAGYNSDRLELELYYSHFGTELGIFRGAHIGNLTDLERAIERGRPIVEQDFTYDIGFPKQIIDHDLLSVNGRYRFESVGELEIQYGWQQNRRKEFDAHAPFSSALPTKAAFDLKLNTYTGDIKFKHNPIKNVFGKIGFSGMRQTNVRKTTGFLIPNFRAYSFGAFLIENWTKEKLTLNTGARFDYRWQKVFAAPSKDIPERIHEWSNVSTVVGMIYQFADTWSIGSNFGTAWRPPSVNELYSDGVHHGTAQLEIGDANLTTEKSLNVDLTLRKVSKRSHLEFSVYNNRINDFIFLFPEPEATLTIRGAFPTFSYRQADAVLRGFDMTFDYQLIDFYQFGLRSSIVRGDNLDEDEPLISMPSDRLKLVNRFTLPDFGKFQEPFFEISTTFVRRQDRFPEGDYVDPPPGYTLFGLDFSTHIEMGPYPINLHLNARNIFNVAYRDYLSRFRYFVDDPGRNVSLKLQIPFGNFAP
ncbi:TonB-dependent receptor [bacterium]|nr:TonB-dependent receptor [bacterium]